MITQQDQNRVHDITLAIADYLVEIERRNKLQHNISDQIAGIRKLNVEIYEMLTSDWTTP